MVQGQQTQHADQQMIFSQKVVVEATSIESTRSCKHCQKDFVHRGSLWRHQMFCDANPERDLNRIVAGSKKKPVVVKVLVLSISFSLSLLFRNKKIKHKTQYFVLFRIVVPEMTLNSK